MRVTRFRVAAAAAAVFAIAACGGTAAPSAAPTTAPVSIAPLPSGLENPSFVIPSFAIPSFAPDAAIEQAFPALIGGQPVTDITSASFLAVLQAFGTESERITAFVAGMQSIGVDPAAVGYGSGTVTLDDETVSLQVVRFPGGNAGNALDILTRIDEPDQPPTLTTETIGGKSVTVATNPDDDVEYFYISGEWAWFLDNVERSHAETIFGALP